MPSMPPTPPTESESEKEKGAEEDQTVTIGDISFMADGETIMVFRDVVEPERVKELVDGLRALGRSSSDDRVEAIVRAKQAR